MGFIEVETPITYLRIAPKLYLKQLVVGGLDRESLQERRYRSDISSGIHDL
jgi:lysyl-tRNA synthetase class II